MSISTKWYSYTMEHFTKVKMKKITAIEKKISGFVDIMLSEISKA